MTEAEIIELVNLAGWDAVDLEDGFGERIKKFAYLVLNAEREACAKIAEDHQRDCYEGDLDWHEAKRITAAIRAKGGE